MKAKYYYGGVKKSKCCFCCHLQIDKKINNQIKKIQGEKLIQTVIFLKLPSAYEVLIKRNVKCSAYIFLHQKRVKQVSNSDRLVEALTP